jgi:hypothetical protein
MTYRGLWVTLATLTSIAAPEDPAMVDTEALIETILQSFGIKMTELDFERFMPIIDRVHRRAQELEIPHLQLKKSYLGKRLKVRQKLPSHYKMTTITLYWANKGEKFNENQIFRQAYNLDGQLNTFHLKIPPTNKKSIKLRLDIATCTGYFFIQQLKIKDIASEDIWIWDFDTHRFKNIADLIFFDCNNKTQANLLSTGRDPQFQLELPNEILQKLSEASLVIEMSGLPCFTKS